MFAAYCTLKTEYNIVEFASLFGNEREGDEWDKSAAWFRKIIIFKMIAQKIAAESKIWTLTKYNRVCLQPPHFKYFKNNSKICLWTANVQINTKLAANKLYVWIDFLNVMKWHTCKYLLFVFAIEQSRILK